MAKNKTKDMSPPAYSSDLDPVDVFLYPILKTPMKRKTKKTPMSGQFLLTLTVCGYETVRITTETISPSVNAMNP